MVRSNNLQQQIRDDRILAENLRTYCLTAKRHGQNLTFAEIARRAGIHPTSLSRILAGNGASEESLLGIAKVLGVAPGRFIARVADINKYPNIQPIRARTSQRRRYTRRIARSIEDLLENPELASDFFGGAPDNIRPWLLKSLDQIRRTCHSYQGRY
jgi:transcriptional regulator with XRE-family HTH domain